MTTIDKIRKEREKKLENLRKKGIDPYPSSTDRTHSIKEALESFKELSEGKQKVVLCGRMRLLREHGKVTFVEIEDGSDSGPDKTLEADEARIQVMFKQDNLGAERYEFFLENFDVGDFIEVEGRLMITRTGEKTIEAQNYKILAKTLRPLPEKWHGLQDKEERFRKRYLDFIFNPELRELFRKKAKFWNSMRDFLQKRGFLEVFTPVLENKAGGANAKPFVTHHESLDIDVYLRISMGELWQKRLMVGGFEKTFEIGRQFRNEGLSKEHLQDYMQMEFYWAYADYEMGMKLVENLYRHIAQETFGTLEFDIFGFEVDLGAEWDRIDYRETILGEFGLDIDKADKKEVRAKLDELGVKHEGKLAWGCLVDQLWKECRKRIKGPAFLTGHPVEVSPLAKRSSVDPSRVERFQVILAGSEMGNGYSELNDPLDQAGRFKEQAALREKGDEEAQMEDEDFVEALEYGMPPTCGFGVSERLFSFLAGKPIKECVMFPLLRPK